MLKLKQKGQTCTLKIERLRLESKPKNQHQEVELQHTRVMRLSLLSAECAQTGATTTAESSTADATDGWPTLWFEEQRAKLCEKYPWLFPNQGKIGE